MIKADIPGRGAIAIAHVVFDVNGTLAQDGSLLPGIPDLLKELENKVSIHLLTADTHGKQKEIDQELGKSAVRVQKGNEAEQKAVYLEGLDGQAAAIGQGANDSLMIKAASIGVCIMSGEGTSVESLLVADIITPDIQTAINLFIHPTRLIASLRK